jgi:hypothetical protein
MRPANRRPLPQPTFPFPAQSHRKNLQPFELAVARARLLKTTVRQNRPARAGGAGDGGRHLGQRGGKTMSNQQTQTSGKANRNTVAAVVLPCLLIGRFLWNVLTPAHEYPMRSVQVMTMTFEAAMLVVLFRLRTSMPKPLFWIALVAGIGLFALRLTGDDGWWTGHLVYFLPPR